MVSFAHHAERVRVSSIDLILLAIAAGESLTVEFKAELSAKNGKGICKEIAAMATTSGGCVLVGVDDDGAIVGVADAVTVAGQIERWCADWIMPHVTVDVSVLAAGDASIIAVSVEKGAAPFYTFDGRPYGRLGTSSVVLGPQQVIDHVRGQTLEQIVNTLESSISTANAMASLAMNATAPAIFGQGEMATMPYGQLRDRLFAELATAPVIGALQANVSVAQSTASLAMVSPSSGIVGQGDLATTNFADLVARLMTSPPVAGASDAARSEAAAAMTAALSTRSEVQALRMQLSALRRQIAAAGATLADA